MEKRELSVGELRAQAGRVLARYRAAIGDTRTDEEFVAGRDKAFGMITREEGEAQIQELEAGPPFYTEENGCICRTVTREELVARVRYQIDHPKRWDER